MDTYSNTTLLKKLPLFSALSEATLAELAAHCRRRTFRANEAIFHEGDPGYILYVIVTGSVHIQRDTAAGTTLHIAQRGPGEAFGELALIDEKPRMADAVTVTQTELLMLDRSAFLQCVEKSPQIAFGVMSYLADRLREAGAHLESRQLLDVRGRLAEKLLELAEQHGCEQEDGAVRIEAKITQHSLAEQIGTTRESINRELARLRKVNVLRLEGRTLVLTDRKKLQRYIQG